MPGEVVHADQRDAQAIGERLREGDPDQQGAHQTGPRRHRDAVESSDAAMPACASAAATTAETLRTWSRDASSGTTPP